MAMKYIKSEIIKNELIVPNYYRIRLIVSGNFKVQAGQFVMIKIDDRVDPLLSRPFSICYTNGKYIEIIYKVVGKTTKLLSCLKKGERLNILGPLGNGFKIDKKIKTHILVAGGHGIAPLLLLAYNLKRFKKEIIVLIGARDKSSILCKDEFKKLGAVVKISTENGSSGHKGFVTDLLKKELEIIQHTVQPNDMGIFVKVDAGFFISSTVIYGCGPMQMLKEVLKIVKKHKILSQLSLESIMGCGIGVCLSCVCKSKNSSYKLTCSDGPVFPSDDIIL